MLEGGRQLETRFSWLRTMVENIVDVVMTILNNGTGCENRSCQFVLQRGVGPFLSSLVHCFERRLPGTPGCADKRP